MAQKKVEIQWLREPEEQDYPAAKSFLGLVYDAPVVSRYLKKLRRASVTKFKAKDIFRASGLSLLGASNPHVEKDLRKIATGQKLSPLVLVRAPIQGKVIIADGYHRLCAAYAYDEDAIIPCKIV
jgi:hypothetical protein